MRKKLKLNVHGPFPLFRICYLEMLFSNSYVDKENTKSELYFCLCENRKLRNYKIRRYCEYIYTRIAKLLIITQKVFSKTINEQGFDKKVLEKRNLSVFAGIFLAKCYDISHQFEVIKARKPKTFSYFALILSTCAKHLTSFLTTRVPLRLP